jgi:creatinine amidohydrolase
MTPLGERTWRDVEGAGPLVLLVPLGSCEQHGPHLPLDTDTRIATALADRAAATVTGCVVAPALAYGASGEHGDFAGTLSIGEEALEHALVELIRSADRLAGVVLVNGHGGNAETVRRAVRTSTSDGRRVLAWAPVVPGGDAHAGATETALLLALAPGTVRPAAAERGTVAPVSELLPLLRAQGVRAVSANGVLGDPSGATAADGALLVALLVTDLCEAITPWRSAW